MVVVQTVTISDPGQSRGCDGVAPSVRRNSQLLKRWWSFDSQDLDSRQLEGTPKTFRFVFSGNLAETNKISLVLQPTGVFCLKVKVSQVVLAKYPVSTRDGKVLLWSKALTQMIVECLVWLEGYKLFLRALRAGMPRAAAKPQVLGSFMNLLWKDEVQ